MSNMYIEKTWTEFRDAGMLWFVNRILHVFGWVIVVTVNTRNDVDQAWPARTKVLGFEQKCDEENQKNFLKYVKNHTSVE